VSRDERRTRRETEVLEKTKRKKTKTRKQEDRKQKHTWTLYRGRSRITRWLSGGAGNHCEEDVMKMSER